MNPIIARNKDQIHSLCKKYFVKRLYLFGSALTDSFHKESDFDFFYEINDIKEKKGFDYASNIFSLEKDLGELLGRKIDLLPHKFNNPPLFIQTVADKKVLLYAE
ncbi:MAG: nucleotidyltransferase domain-containing protein [Flavisolibacter sp.]|nr:nucleotidyltransferase domain-containing protein [Flavisolibacter sp.]